MLYGIRPDEQRRLAAAGTRVRAYVPYGVDWYAYFMRRLAERPANVGFFLRSLAHPKLLKEVPPWTPSPVSRPRATSRSSPTPPARPSAPRCEARLRRAGRRAGRADQHDRRPAADGRRASSSRSSSRTGTPPSSGRRRTPRTPTPRTPSAAPKEAAPGWAELSFDDRAAVFLKAADLLAGPWRQTLNAATMLGQSKTAYQAEIDAACELIDFWRFNVHFARQILAEQPESSPGVWNRVDHRPLEGFVYAITPFNFTAIAGNLPTAPALMGNTVVWKPAPTQQFAAHFLMRLLEAAGLPPGVINMVTGDGIAVSEVALAAPRPRRHPLHRLDAGLPAPVADGRGEHRLLPRLPAHRRRDRRQGLRRRAPVGRRRRAAHRAGPRRLRVPGPEVLGGLARLRPAQRVGAAARRPGRDDRVAVDGRRHRLLELHGRGHRPEVVLQAVRRPGPGEGRRRADRRRRRHGRRQRGLLRAADDHRGHRPRPRGVHHRVLRPGAGGARLRRRRLRRGADPDGVGGAVRADRRRSSRRTAAAIAHAQQFLRNAAGNFYVNDKPTGAVVGQQPFGGGRASGTNDKAGAPQNLLRWTSTRSIKETFVPATDHRYPHMG